MADKAQSFKQTGSRKKGSRSSSDAPLPFGFSQFLILVFVVLYTDSLANAQSPPALFVFGDSYADTGNHDTHDSRLFASWQPPYGHTWPGYPAGRFSDGKVLTDFIVSFLNISSPLPYRERGFHPEFIARGINFAFGGSGVFDTYGPEYPTIDAQIDQLDQIIKTGLYTRGFLANSVVLFVYAGNDYAAYLSKHPKAEGLTSFIPDVVNQIAAGLTKLYKLGFHRFAATNLEPTGCLPVSTFTNNFISCSKEYNVLTSLHNKLLKAEILKFQKQQRVNIFLLDQYKAFKRSLNITFSELRGTRNILQPCCLGMGNFSCGASDSEGRPLYTVCSSPGEAFFWDSVHPTEAGWRTITQYYKTDIISHFGCLKQHGSM